MRIVGGALRGRQLTSRLSASTRPTSDRVREGIASALEARSAIQGASVLDLFAGTGALGLEALSRGAASSVAVDADRAALRCIQNNAIALGLQDQVRALQLDLLGSGAKVSARLSQTGLAPFSLVFADPPYALVSEAVRLLAGLTERGLLKAAATVVLEHAQRAVPVRPARFLELATYRYGDTAVVLWEAIASDLQT
jgi:16S rRNA (guanine966-N2)-methyltransferase